MISPARLAAYEILRAVDRGQMDVPTALASSRVELADARDRSLAAELVRGTFRWRGKLDHLIVWAGERPLNRFDPEVLDILRLGAYQLLHLDRVPAAAVVDDAVDLTRRVRRRSATGAVNAILRRISRARLHLPLPTEDAPLDYLSVTLSHPRWLAARWLERYGFTSARFWASFNNQPAPMTLRTNTLRTTRAALVEALHRHGVETEPARYAADALIVIDGQPLATPLAAQGLFTVQDEASQLVGAFVAPQSGQRVLDTCAAPGGKTTHMACAMGNVGMIVATDLRPRRVALLRATVRDHGATCVHIARVDTSCPLPFAPVFDGVLVDAPCSGLGTIRRDPDVRWRRQEAEIPALVATQTRMVTEAAAVVRPGGRLSYATCSSEPEENEGVVDAFLDTHRDFVGVDPRHDDRPLAQGLAPCLDPIGRLRTTPHEHGLDAFFAAILERSRR